MGRRQKEKGNQRGSDEMIIYEEEHANNGTESGQNGDLRNRC